MSSGNVHTTFTSDETALVKAQDKLIKQTDQAVEKYKKLAAEAKTGGKEISKATTDAAKEMDRFARATKDVNRTPLEKYADAMRKLDQALQRGKIDQETFNRAVARAKTEFDGAGAAGNRAFGPGAASGLDAYLGRLAKIVAGAAAAKKILDEARQEAEGMGEKQALEAPSLGSLMQLGETTADRDRLLDEVRKTFIEGGARTIPEAVQLQKTLESGNIQEWRSEMARAQASGLVNAEQLSLAAIKMSQGLGKQETGGFGSIMSKLLGAAKVGIGETHEIGTAVGYVSQQAGRLGLTDEEVMAAISTASAVAGPSEAGTQIQALMKGIEVEGIGGGFLQKGKTLREQVAKIKELEAGGADIREILGGRQEAVMGYGSLASVEGQKLMNTNLANIARAEQEDWFGKQVELAESIPENAAATIKRKRENRATWDTYQVGVYENIADAVAADQKEYQRQRYGGGFMGDIAAAGEGIGMGIHRWVSGNRQFIASGMSEGVSEETRAAAATIEAAMELREAAARLGVATEDPNLTNAARANQAAAGGAVEAR